MLFTNILQANKDELSSIKVQINKNKGSIYELLQDISEQTDYFFTYDSQLIDNDKIVKVNRGTYSLLGAVHAITNNPRLEARLVGSHILLYIPKPKQESSIKKTETKTKSSYTIEGVIHDGVSQEPIPYGFVSINGTNIGTATNYNGEFRLVIPDSLAHITVKFSHLGYKSKEFETSIASTLSNQRLVFTLEPQYISLQEVTIRVINPMQQIQKMLYRRDENYSPKAVQMTTFYREIVEHKKNMIITEGVLSLYKTGYHNLISNDPTKLVKMRTIIAQNQKDSISTKIKAGIKSVLDLDIMKDLSAFLMLNEDEPPYAFWYTGMTSIDGRDINIIAFEQKRHIKEPFHKGELYIDAENSALVEIRFEINPAYVENATSTYVVRQAKTHKITLQQASYTISYKPNDKGIYFLSVVRGDILFKIKKKKGLFSSPLKVSFEMIVCDIKTENIKAFSKEERLQTHKVFSETKHLYDVDFWEDFNTIMPENEVRKFIMNNLVNISEISLENDL